jgi:hypothetical protein
VGSELNWIPSYVNESGVIDSYPAREYFAYVGFMPAPGPTWRPSDFDFDRDYKRLGAAESLFGAADNPDLRKFKSLGAKMMMCQGAQDESDIPTDAIDYYETTEGVIGGRDRTQDFFRLFVIPGMNHCTRGPGAFAVDYLSYLVSWVEQDRAPDKIVGAHVDVEDGDFLESPLPPGTAVQFTRPVFPYPLRATYSGRGSTKDESSFQPEGPNQTSR